MRLAPIHIVIDGNYGTRELEILRFAAKELQAYLCRMSGNSQAAVVDTRSLTNLPAIRLGLLSEFGLSVEGVRDEALDDAIHVEVKHSEGMIAGSNPRSVLFGVYRFLEQNGCVWIRPGANGEIVPSRTIGDLRGTVHELAGNRFRGFNNCGTYNLESMLEKIAWAPKVGLNTVVAEFMLPSELFNGWYDHAYYSLLSPECRSEADIRAYRNETVAEIKRRGMIYQAVGHGWNGRCFGLSEAMCSIPYPTTEMRFEVSEEERVFLPMLNGKRESHAKGALYTELCYGNPEVRQRLAHIVADYAEEHPEIDFLHFWLSDGTNANCECELCRDTRPSDFYMMILNGIDAELTNRGCKARIAFLVYSVLFYPPEKERLRHPERFIMMYAPIDRNYRSSYITDTDGVEIPAYQLNKTPKWTEEQFTASLRTWQQWFHGDSFVYDYHMTWRHYYDHGYYGLTEVLAEDIRKLPAMGLGGYVACEVLRSTFPHSYPYVLKARLLWNPELSEDEAAASYFASAFGEAGGECRMYMRELSAASATDFFYSLRQPLDNENEVSAAAGQLSRIQAIVDRFRPIVEKNLFGDHPAREAAWMYIFLHMDMVATLARAQLARVEGRQQLADAYWLKTAEYVLANEDRLCHVFDLFWFFRTYEKSRNNFMPYRSLSEQWFRRLNPGYAQ